MPVVTTKEKLRKWCSNNFGKNSNCSYHGLFVKGPYTVFKGSVFLFIVEIFCIVEQSKNEISHKNVLA